MSLACSLTGYGSSLIVNGSFEDGNFVPNAQDTMPLSLGSTDMTGWAVTDAALAWIGPGNPFGLAASDGSYFLDLSGYHDNAPYAGVAQTVPIATVVGITYRITFDLGSDSGYNSGPVSIVVSAGSGAGLVSTTFTSTPTGLNQWEGFAFDYIASATTTPISFTGSAASDQAYVGLDNVSMVAIPEPSVLALGGWGLLTLLILRRRT